MKRIAVVTSGGDAPGMNAAIRAVVRTGLEKGWEVLGVYYGYHGLINGNIKELGARDVGGIIHLGGTVLESRRCPEFQTGEGITQALRMLNKNNIDALVVIGGNGSQTGAYELCQRGYPVVGVASTIDNDLYGTDISIGANTAVSIAVEAIERLKVTASSHERVFLVEVMGRHCGYIALMAGIAGGADAIVIPENEMAPESVAKVLSQAYERGKTHAVVVIAEGAKNNAEKMSLYFEEHKKRLGFELRKTILGHVQRGGSPCTFDRLLATQFGAAATECVAKDECGLLVGLTKGEVKTVPLAEVVGKTRKPDLKLLELAKILAK